jgi:hypothetical protein
MFIGHYGVAFATKARAPSLKLWWLFVAVQLLDLLFALFLLAGVEHMRMNEGTASRNVYDVFSLYDMRLSHSLIGALSWGLVGALAARRWLPRRAAIWIGIAIVSHFVLDVPMHPNDPAHPPDLHVGGPGTAGVGLGLWHHPAIAVALELVVFGGGVALYARSRWPLPPRMWAMIALLAGLAIAPLLIPPSGTPLQFAIQILVVVSALALWAAWAERPTTAARRFAG